MGRKITAIGEVLTDLTQTNIDNNGIAHFAANPGGAPANVAVAASRLGHETAFVGCVGKDTFGRLLKQTLSDNNVDISGLQETDSASTTMAVVTVSKTGERSFSFCRKPGADTQIDIRRAIEAVRGTYMLHFGSVSLTDPGCRKTIEKVIRTARKDGAVITYDPNYRASLWESQDQACKVMRSVLRYCDIVKISDEETLLMTGEQEPEKAARVLIEAGVKLVVVTLGANGAFYCTKDAQGTVPGFKVRVADTNGAGDTFFGALIGEIAANGGLENITGEKLEQYVRFANKAASLTASRSGAIPAMPYRRELEGTQE